MTKTSSVVYNDRYEMSRNDYNTLVTYLGKIQEILSNAKVVEKDKSVANASAPAAAKPAASTTAIIREQATQSALQRVMGVHYTECAIYDCENNKLLTQTYNGERVYWDYADTNNTKTFKDWFDKEFKKENLTLVCSVSKQVSERDYPGWGQWTQSGQQIRMNTKGSYTVCNFIVRNETTGKLEMFNDAAWLGVGIRENPDYAARNGAYGVAYCGAGYSDFRSAVRAGYQR